MVLGLARENWEAPKQYGGGLVMQTLPGDTSCYRRLTRAATIHAGPPGARRGNTKTLATARCFGHFSVMKRSAGILVYRFVDGALQVLLAHPGGPFWERKDAGVWTIPKGEFENEDALAAARREFEEETGSSVDGNFVALTPCLQKNGKIVHAFAIEGELDASTITSNTFTMEWPPGSGKRCEFPEVDRVQWFALSDAAEKINPAQRAFLAELKQKLEAG